MIKCNTMLKEASRADANYNNEKRFMELTGMDETIFTSMNIDTYAVYFDDDTEIDLTTKQELKVLATSFRRTKVVTSKLRELRKGQHFGGLQLLCELPTGDKIAVGVNATSANGLFKYINDITLGLDIPTVENENTGEMMYDYRTLYNNQVFMDKLIEKLTELDSMVEDLRVQLSTGFTKPKEDRYGMLSKIYPKK